MGNRVVKVFLVVRGARCVECSTRCVLVMIHCVRRVLVEKKSLCIFRELFLSVPCSAAWSEVNCVTRKAFWFSYTEYTFVSWSKMQCVL